MSQKIQLQIANPCQESWEAMRPEESGRYCGSCQKTVIDFTLMTDAEVLSYLSRTGPHVCGRLMSDQLNRDLAGPRKPHWLAGRWIQWHWVLAGLLMTVRVQGQTKTAKAPTHQQWQAGGMGRPVVCPDTARVPVDSFKMLPEVVVRGYGVTKGRVMVSGGLVTVIRASKWDTLTKIVKDTVSALNVFADKPLTIFPCPVQRGQAVNLSWKTEPGQYRVAIYDMGGALVLQKEIAVNSKGQTDVIGIPASMAAGVYIVRADRPGGGKVYSRELLVR